MPETFQLSPIRKGMAYNDFLEAVKKNMSILLNAYIAGANVIQFVGASGVTGSAGQRGASLFHIDSENLIEAMQVQGVVLPESVTIDNVLLSAENTRSAVSAIMAVDAAIEVLFRGIDVIADTNDIVLYDTLMFETGTICYLTYTVSDNDKRIYTVHDSSLQSEQYLTIDNEVVQQIIEIVYERVKDQVAAQQIVSENSADVPFNTSGASVHAYMPKSIDDQSVYDTTKALIYLACKLADDETKSTVLVAGTNTQLKEVYDALEVLLSASDTSGAAVKARATMPTGYEQPAQLVIQTATGKTPIYESSSASNTPDAALIDTPLQADKKFGIVLIDSDSIHRTIDGTVMSGGAQFGSFAGITKAADGLWILSNCDTSDAYGKVYMSKRRYQLAITGLFRAQMGSRAIQVIGDVTERYGYSYNSSLGWIPAATTTAKKYIGGSAVRDINGSFQDSIGGSHTKSVQFGYDETVGGAKSEGIGGSRTITVGGYDWKSVDGNMTVRVTGAVIETFLNGHSLNITGNDSETITGGKTKTVGGAEVVSITGAKSETIGGSKTSIASGDRTIQTGGTHTETITGELNYVVKNPATFNFNRDGSDEWIGLSVGVVGQTHMTIDGNYYLSATGSAAFYFNGDYDQTAEGHHRTSVQKLHYHAPYSATLVRAYDHLIPNEDDIDEEWTSYDATKWFDSDFSLYIGGTTNMTFSEAVTLAIQDELDLSVTGTASLRFADAVELVLTDAFSLTAESIEQTVTNGDYVLEVHKLINGVDTDAYWHTIRNNTDSEYSYFAATRQFNSSLSMHVAGQVTEQMLGKTSYIGDGGKTETITGNVSVMIRNNPPTLSGGVAHYELQVYNGNHRIIVGGSDYKQISGTSTTEVNGDYALIVGSVGTAGNMSETITGMYAQDISGSATISTIGTKTEFIGGQYTRNITGGAFIDNMPGHTETVSGEASLDAGSYELKVRGYSTHGTGGVIYDHVIANGGAGATTDNERITAPTIALQMTYQSLGIYVSNAYAGIDSNGDLQLQTNGFGLMNSGNHNLMYMGDNYLEQLVDTTQGSSVQVWRNEKTKQFNAGRSAFELVINEGVVSSNIWQNTAVKNDSYTEHNIANLNNVTVKGTKGHSGDMPYLQGSDMVWGDSELILGEGRNGGAGILSLPQSFTIARTGVNPRLPAARDSITSAIEYLANVIQQGGKFVQLTSDYDDIKDSYSYTNYNSIVSMPGVGEDMDTAIAKLAAKFDNLGYINNGTLLSENTAIPLTYFNIRNGSLKFENGNYQTTLNRYGLDIRHTNDYYQRAQVNFSNILLQGPYSHVGQSYEYVQQALYREYAYLYKLNIHGLIYNMVDINSDYTSGPYDTVLNCYRTAGITLPPNPSYGQTVFVILQNSITVTITPSQTNGKLTNGPQWRDNLALTTRGDFYQFTYIGNVTRGDASSSNPCWHYVKLND